MEKKIELVVKNKSVDLQRGSKRKFAMDEEADFLGVCPFSHEPLLTFA